MREGYLLEGKVALVTGGSSGIGKVTAMTFARAGARVVIASRRPDEGRAVVDRIRAEGDEAHFVRTDVSVEQDCANMVAYALDAFGLLDIGFNNAGVTRVGVNIVNDEASAWDAIYAVNVRGVFLSMKYEIAALLRSGGGSIVNTSSIGGLVGGRGQGAYRASKHAVIGMTKVAALEYAQKGVRVNAVCPGVTRTEMLTAAEPSEADMLYLSSLHPIGRIAEAEEVAQTVLFLASEAASFITGQAVVVDGGLTAQ